MLDATDNQTLPEIPAKRYFTIGEVSKLCRLKPHVLRYWEQEFPQLNPVKRRGNRRYYQRHEVELIRRIRELLYIDGFTINGARIQIEQLLDDGAIDFKDVSGERSTSARNKQEGLQHSAASNSNDSAVLRDSENQTTSDDVKDEQENSVMSSSTVNKAQKEHNKTLELLLSELKHLRSTLEN